MPAARRPLAPGDGWPTAALGVIWLAFPLSLFPFAEQHVSSALTGMLNGATPIFTAIVAGAAGAALAVAAVVSGPGHRRGGLRADGGAGPGRRAAAPPGVAMIVAALVSYGVALNLARPLQQRSGALPVVWRALGVAVLLTAPLGLPALLAAQWTPRALLSMLALGALGTCVANVLMTMAAGRVGATRASATLFLIPVVALVLGVVMRGEQVAPLSIAGAAVCLAGAWMIRRGPSAGAGAKPQPLLQTNELAAADTTITEPSSRVLIPSSSQWLISLRRRSTAARYPRASTGSPSSR